MFFQQKIIIFPRCYWIQIFHDVRDKGREFICFFSHLFYGLVQSMLKLYWVILPKIDVLYGAI